MELRRAGAKIIFSLGAAWRSDRKLQDDTRWLTDAAKKSERQKMASRRVKRPARAFLGGPERLNAVLVDSVGKNLERL